MNQEIRLLDFVALAEDVPDRGIVRGQVGTAVEELAPGVYEVEFSDNAGRAYATGAVNAASLITRHYQNAQVG